LTNSDASAPEWAAENRRELINTRPTWIIDGLGPLNPRWAITNYPDLREWLANYQETARTKFTVIYRIK
jgi:hypothetical protein